VNESLASLAIANGDEFLALLLAEFQRDSTRSQNWTAALVQYAIEKDPALAGVLREALDAWAPRVDSAIAGIAELFAGAPTPIDPAQVRESATQARDRLIGAAGL
jgi:toluene monooxygenase system protein E